MEANVIVIDRIASVAVANGLLRIECVSLSAGGQEKPSGTLLIPANVAGPIVQSLVTGLQELDKKMRGAGAASDFPSTIPTGNMKLK